MEDEGAMGFYRRPTEKGICRDYRFSNASICVDGGGGREGGE